MAADRHAGATPAEGQQLAFDVGQVDERTGFRAPTVCKIVGITYRQLDYWARKGYVTPSVQQATGSGTQRLYSFEDVVELRVFKRLLDTGVSLQRVRRAIEEMRARGANPAEVTVISDGQSVYMVDDQQEVIDLLSQGQGVFAIALGPVVEQLRGEVTAFPMERVDDTPVAMPDQDVPAAEAT